MYDLKLTIGHNVDNQPTHNQQHVLDTFLRVMNEKETLVHGYTAYETTGLWEGKPESSTRLEVNGVNAETRDKIRALIPVLARKLEQHEIYYDAQPCTSQVVTATEDVQTVTKTA